MLVMKERLRKIDPVRLTIVISYALILLIPIYNRVTVNEGLFGNDVAQYLLTAKCLIEGKENLFIYPYFVVPLLYIIPALIIVDPLTLYVFALFISGILMILITYVMYRLLERFLKTVFARIISVLFFGTFPLTLDIIGWGGQSTLVAVLFGLSATILMTSYFTYSKTKSLVLSSFMLLLSVLSEPYISIYFLIVVGMSVLWKIKQYDLRTLFKKFAPLIIPSLTMIIFFLGLNIHSKVLLPLAIYTIINPSIFNELIARLTFNVFVMYLAVLTISLTYLVWKLTTKSDDYVPIVASTIIAFFIQVSITPAQFADRGIFLASIPLTLMFGKVVDYWICNQITRLKPLIAVTLLFTSLCFGVGINIYYNSLGFYLVDKDILSGTTFIRYENGNVLFISSRPWIFPLPYITEKDVYPTTQPVWFIKPSQIEASILAYTLAWGVRWIDAGEIKVVDATPVWAQPAPAIYVARYPYYVELFRLSDGVLPIVFSPSNNESIVWHESPFYAKEIKAWSTNTEMFSVYMYDTLTIRKIISVEDDGIINIALSYNFVNSFPHEIRVRLISLMLRDTKGIITFNNDTYVRINLLQSFKEPWLKQYYNSTIEIYILNSNIKTFAEFVEYDEWGLPEIMITLKPKVHVDNITVLLKTKIDDVNINTPRVILENSVIMDKKIKWIVIDKNVHPDIIQRFQNDPLYEKYIDQQKYVIFRAKV